MDFESLQEAAREKSEYNNTLYIHQIEEYKCSKVGANPGSLPSEYAKRCSFRLNPTFHNRCDSGTLLVVGFDLPDLPDLPTVGNISSSGS